MLSNDLGQPCLSNLAGQESALNEPLSIYIHWPFCQSKCPYCDFNSHVARTVDEATYVQHLLTELCHYHRFLPGRPIQSVFFGGGTPSLMGAASVGALLDAIADLWPVSLSCEITLEANPSSIEASRFQGYRSAGVNRVSIGVQSLDDTHLRGLGRLHTSAQARDALTLAARHFERFSFDLIYARPSQTVGEWRRELKEALALSGGHLSLYQLTIEPETAFFDLHRRGKLHTPSDEQAAALYETTQEICEDAGLPAYEISNHAIPGQESQHNLVYWRYGDYLGVGAGAHGRFSVGSARYATSALKPPASWAAQVSGQGHGRETWQNLTPHEQAEEMILMGLRLTQGMPLDDLSHRTGFQLHPESVMELTEQGFLQKPRNTLALTRDGRLVLDAIVAALVKTMTPAPSNKERYPQTGQVRA